MGEEKTCAAALPVLDFFLFDGKRAGRNTFDGFVNEHVSWVLLLGFFLCVCIPQRRWARAYPPLGNSGCFARCEGVVDQISEDSVRNRV